MNCKRILTIFAGLSAIGGCDHLPRIDSFEPSGKKVKMPAAPTISAKSYETGRHVERVGRDLLIQNPFSGLDPLFHTVCRTEPMIFHRGPGELFISEGLVDRCKTDEQLAAVLCSELGKMKSEKLAARRVGQDRNGFPEKDAVKPAPTLPAEPLLDPGVPSQHARDLLIGAGIDPTELDRVAPLLRESEKNEGLRKQMAGCAPAPHWRR